MKFGFHPWTLKSSFFVLELSKNSFLHMNFFLSKKSPGTKNPCVKTIFLKFKDKKWTSCKIQGWKQLFKLYFIYSDTEVSLYLKAFSDTFVVHVVLGHMTHIHDLDKTVLFYILK